MKSPFSPDSLTIRCLAAFIALWFAQKTSCRAVLTADVRAVSLPPEFGTIVDAKTVRLYPNAVGADLILELWAVVRGVDGVATNEALTSVLGSLVSSPGTTANRDAGVAGNQALPASPNTIHGNLSNLLTAPWHTAATANDGAIVDLDGDGDLDVGSLANSIGGDYINANALILQNGAGFDPANYHLLADGLEFKISTVIFHITDLQSDGLTGVNFLFPAFSTSLTEIARARFATDGVTRTGADANIAVGAPVLINVVPEPATAGLACLGLLALTAGRRRTR